jgi:DNA repair exonuclease SbcCD nuclease subunit
MKDFKFLHAADIHLDSPLRGLSQYEGVPATLVRTATRDALDNLVSKAIEEGVAFVVIAGDLYDGEWDAFSTGLFFCSAMGRLQRAGIAVFIVLGNHDAESQLTRQLPLPDNVHVFSTRKAETIRHEASGTVLHGHSYKTREPDPDLALGYPAAVAGAFNIGVLHTALTGNRGPHASYAPCTPAQLSAKAYDYWALGHVHTFETVETDPYIVFPGNLQGRNIRETGPKGAVLVSVSDGRVTEAEHVALDVVRWALVEVDLSGIELETAAHERIRLELTRALAAEADGRPLMVRVRLSGATPLHDGLADQLGPLREEVRAIAGALCDTLWLEKVVVGTHEPPTIMAVEGFDDFQVLLGDLAKDPMIAAQLSADLAEFLSKAPADLGDDLELIADLRAGQFGNLLEDAVGALQGRLEPQGGS